MAEFLKGVSPAAVFARPAADAIWLGAAQKAALEQLSEELSEDCKTRVLVGPPSSGRTTILQHLPTILATHAVIGITGPQSDVKNLLGSALVSASLAPWGLAETDLRNLLAVFVRQRASQGRRTVLSIDNAERLSEDAWEEIERWRTWEEHGRPLLELAICVTSGKADTDSLIESQLKSSNVHVLEAPGESEIAEYIDWCLRRFELNGLFADSAIPVIARYSAGRFRAVNVFAQMALLMMRRRGSNCVDAEMVQQAAFALARRRAPKTEGLPAPSLAESPTDGPPAAHLIISRDGAIVSRVALGKRLLIGRSKHNDLCLPSPYLSRHHAAIIGTTEGYYVVDLNSANGFMVNNELKGRALLYDQDVLSLGPYRLKVQVPGGVMPADPFPDAPSLAETALMPAQESGEPPMRMVQG